MPALTPFRTALLEAPIVVTATITGADTLDEFASDAAATVTYQASGADTLDDFTSAASATVTYQASGAGTLDDFTMIATGTVTITVGTVNVAVRGLTRTTKIRGLTT